MSPFRIGVLGCDMIADLGHLPALRNASDLVLDAWPIRGANRDRHLASDEREFECLPTSMPDVINTHRIRIDNVLPRATGHRARSHGFKKYES